jgi:hypothetical protein
MLALDREFAVWQHPKVVLKNPFPHSDVEVAIHHTNGSSYDSEGPGYEVSPASRPTSNFGPWSEAYLAGN